MNTEPIVSDETNPDPVEEVIPASGEDLSAELTGESPVTDDLPIDITHPAEDIIAESEPPDIETEPEVEATAAPRPAPRQLSREDRQTYERTVRRFQACGRCGYLLADCRLALGEEGLQNAILAARQNWLQVDGTETIGAILIRAFGIRLDDGFDYFDGRCPECYRRFVYAVEEMGRANLKIAI